MPFPFYWPHLMLEFIHFMCRKSDSSPSSPPWFKILNSLFRNWDCPCTLPTSLATSRRHKMPHLFHACDGWTTHWILMQGIPSLHQTKEHIIQETWGEKDKEKQRKTKQRRGSSVHPSKFLYAGICVSCKRRHGDHKHIHWHIHGAHCLTISSAYYHGFLLPFLHTLFLLWFYVCLQLCRQTDTQTHCMYVCMYTEL